MLYRETNSRIDENARLNDCFRDKKDWRACKDEVSEVELRGGEYRLLFFFL